VKRTAWSDVTVAAEWVLGGGNDVEAERKLRDAIAAGARTALSLVISNHEIDLGRPILVTMAPEEPTRGDQAAMVRRFRVEATGETLPPERLPVLQQRMEPAEFIRDIAATQFPTTREIDR
jgi:hypothetical protein